MNVTVNLPSVNGYVRFVLSDHVEKDWLNFMIFVENIKNIPVFIWSKCVYRRDGKSVDMGGGTNTLPRRQTLKRLESDEKKKVEVIMLLVIIKLP